MNDDAPKFFIELWTMGKVRLDAPDVPTPVREELESQIREVVEMDRLDLPGAPIPVSTPDAVWAAMIFFNACRLLVCRDLPVEAVKKVFAMKCPHVPSPTVCYSVDLTFRYLPGLLALGRGLAEDDPLVAALMELAKQWPLSSVGVAGLSEIDIASFIDHPVLRQVYINRIIERADRSRVNHPAVREALRSALGAYASLAPELASAIEERT